MDMVDVRTLSWGGSVLNRRQSGPDRGLVLILEVDLGPELIKVAQDRQSSPEAWNCLQLHGFPLSQ